MRVERPHQNELQATIEADDNFELAVEHATAQARDDQSVWNLMVVVPSEIYSATRINLQSLGFVPAGNLSIDNQTFMKLKLVVRRSSDGGQLAVDEPTLPPTATECQAIQALFARHPDLKDVWTKFTKNKH